MSNEISISLEETNKIRISLGLKPLTNDSAPTDNKEKAAEENYARKRAEEREQEEQLKIREKIAKVKNKHELSASLKGATLGDADADVDNTLAWIKRAKKREKELVRKRIEELESMDRHFQGDEYTEKDLVGLKVRHDFEELGEGEDRILTLKDSRILDNEEDELQNVEMAETERTRKRNEMKIKKRDYTGYDDDEFAEGKAGIRKSILAKYDEELEGPQETGFRLGAGAPRTSKSIREEQEQVAAAVNKSLLSIDYIKNLEIADYLQEGDIGFKKPKTKKKRPTRRVAEDSGIEQPFTNGVDRMDVDEKPSASRETNLDMNFVDDDDLQASLARARRAKAMRKLRVPTQEEFAARLAEERARVSNEHVDEAIVKAEDGDDSGLVFDDTSEFVRAIQYNPAPVKEEPREPSVKRDSPSPADVRMESEEPMEELEAGEVRMKEEEDEEAMLHTLQGAMEAAEHAETKIKNEIGDVDVGTSSEKTYGGGLAGALQALKNQGVLAASSADMKERERIQKQRDLWLAEYRTRMALRELEKAKAKGEKKDQAQREYENRLREQQDARQNMEMFKDYKPDVNIVYHDEFGRELTPKEAWKALSHKFHGKGSGKMKTEKRLKKIAEEKKKEAMASGDTPLSMNRAFQARQEKTGQAHFVLSVGSRGAVPQAAEFLEPPTLSKGKTEKVKNKKEKAAAINMTVFTSQPPSRPLSASMSPGPGGPSGGSDSPAPASMMKPSFSQVSEPVSGAGTPMGDSTPRTKLSFGFGRKRKAEGGIDTPPSKKR